MSSPERAIVMFTKMHTALRHLASRFIRERDGSVLPTFVLALVPMIGMVGAAVDYSGASGVKTSLQATLDAAVLAGAKDGTSNWAQTALTVFNGTVAAKARSTVATPKFTLNGTTYTGTVTASVPTNFVGIFGMKSINVSVLSAALAGGVPDNSCLLTLDKGKPLSDTSMTFNGAPDVSLTGCTLRSNTSMSCNGHSGGAAASVAAGLATGCSNPQSNASVIPDIYAALASNITMKCNGATPGATWSPGTPPLPPSMVTVSAGGYTEYHVCGDLTLSGSGYLLGASPASDSIIIIENGSLNIADSTSINTVRTAIVLTGNNKYASSINFPNGKGHASTLSLSPPTSANDPWQGVSLYQDPALTNSVDDTWGPGATFNADGVVYLPNANVTFSGSGASNNSNCTKIVTNTFTTNGSVNLNFGQSAGGCSSLGVKQYSGTAVHLVQ
jgi:Flp pilus assembly protein TadG